MNFHVQEQEFSGVSLFSFQEILHICKRSCIFFCARVFNKHGSGWWGFVWICPIGLCGSANDGKGRKKEKKRPDVDSFVRGRVGHRVLKSRDNIALMEIISVLIEEEVKVKSSEEKEYLIGTPLLLLKS